MTVNTSQPWVQQAACRGNPEPWTGHVAPKVRAEAKRVCLEECPVLSLCRQAGRGEGWLVWAGVDHHDRETGLDKTNPTRFVYGHTADGDKVVRYMKNESWFRVPKDGSPRIRLNVKHAAALVVEGTFTLGLAGGTSFDDHVMTLLGETE